MSHIRDIGQRIISVRKRLGLNQGQAGVKCGLSQSVMSSIERGEGGATLENLLALMDKLNINPTWLLTGAGPMFIYDAIQPHVVESLGRTAEVLASDSPALLAVLSDEELRAIGEISFEELQYLAHFMKANPMLNQLSTVDIVINVLEGYRMHKLGQVKAAKELLRDRANRTDKGD